MPKRTSKNQGKSRKPKRSKFDYSSSSNSESSCDCDACNDSGERWRDAVERIGSKASDSSSDVVTALRDSDQEPSGSHQKSKRPKRTHGSKVSLTRESPGHSRWADDELEESVVLFSVNPRELILSSDNDEEPPAALPVQDECGEREEATEVEKREEDTLRSEETTADSQGQDEEGSSKLRVEKKNQEKSESEDKMIGSEKPPDPVRPYVKRPKLSDLQINPAKVLTEPPKREESGEPSTMLRRSGDDSDEEGRPKNDISSERLTTHKDGYKAKGRSKKTNSSTYMS